MSSDEAYASFLDKANQPTATMPTTSSSSISQPRHQQQDQLISESTNIPISLRSLNATFTSESDEPFEPFTTTYSGSSLPSATEFAKAMKLDKGDGEVEELSVQEFDPKGEYGEVIETVKAASEKGQVGCFRVEGNGKSKTRVFYYVVGIEKDGKEGRRLIGVRAVSVES